MLSANMDRALKEHLEQTREKVVAMWSAACERVMAQAVLNGATPETHILVTRDWTPSGGPGGRPVQEAWVAPIGEAAQDQRRYPLARLEWEDDLSVRIEVLEKPEAST